MHVPLIGRLTFVCLFLSIDPNLPRDLLTVVASRED
jgi:hypothetical protein